MAPMHLELTWNLIATPVLLLILSVVIKSWFTGLEKRAEERYSAIHKKVEEGLNSKTSKEVCELKHKNEEEVNKELRCDIKEIKNNIAEIFKISRDHLKFHAHTHINGENEA